eukprot:3577327-Alexandrium_andersonii.AAC.1
MQLGRLLWPAPPEFAALLPHCARSGGWLDAVKADCALARQELGFLSDTPDPFEQWGEWIVTIRERPD